MQINPGELTPTLTLLTRLPRFKSVLEVHNDCSLLGYLFRYFFRNDLILSCVTPSKIDFPSVYNEIKQGEIIYTDIKRKSDISFCHPLPGKYTGKELKLVLNKLLQVTRRTLIIAVPLPWYGTSSCNWTLEDLKLLGADILMCDQVTKKRSFLAVFTK